ncbi:MAG: four helix bundle protein, partial [Proteobacteria bacterium]|nr:four helix bundle protein [Pseudomonadota bacterium]
MSYIGYEDLKVYKLSRRLAIELHKLSLEWPKTEQFGAFLYEFMENLQIARKMGRTLVI